MISRVRGQPADVRTDGLDGVPRLSLHRSRRTVACGQAILEIDGRRCATWVY